MLKIKKIFSAFVGMAMAANTLMTMPFSAFADEETSRTYTYDDYEILYDVTNSWGNTEVVSVTLSNTGDSTIENWMSVVDLASVILFSDGASEEQGLTNEKMDLKDAIKKVETYGHGTTNYESALRYSIDSLKNQGNSNCEKAIIFLSDGCPTNIVDGVGVEIPEDEFDYSLVDEAAAKGIRIYTIGLTKDLFEDGVKRRWGGLYSGTKYDFYPGLSINVNVRFINYNENTMTDCRYIIANLTNTMGGVSSTSGGYDTTENKTITMKSLGDLASIYEGICAHEFGHTLLLADAYPSANHGYTPVISTDNNRELYCTVTNAAYGRPDGGEIMYYNSDALPNDIEMLLIGYSYNEKQYFTPWNNRVVSHAIKESNIYLNTEDKKYYIWENGAFVEYTEGDIA